MVENYSRDEAIGHRESNAMLTRVSGAARKQRHSGEEKIELCI